MPDSPGLIRPQDSVLVVIDIQERLAPVIADKEAVIDNVIKLVKFARIIDLPIVVTEQDKLGPTLPQIGRVLGAYQAITKITFDCLGEPAFVAELERLGRPNLILTGIEAHICVAQTALTAAGEYNVHVAADAVGSRAAFNRDIALRRLEAAGPTLTTTEMVIYELLGRAGTDEFRQALKLVK